MTKQDLMDIISAEIEDRTIDNRLDELAGLYSLLKLVRDEAKMKYEEYVWLAYLTAQAREAAIRDELE